MKLLDLQPKLVRYETRPDRYADSGVSEYLPAASSLADAQGLLFLCPTCFIKNGGAIGTHAIQVSFAARGVEDHQGSHDDEGKPVRWNISGADLTDLTTIPSVLVTAEPPACSGWHGFITAGEVSA